LASDIHLIHYDFLFDIHPSINYFLIFYLLFSNLVIDIQPIFC